MSRPFTTDAERTAAIAARRSAATSAAGRHNSGWEKFGIVVNCLIAVFTAVIAWAAFEGVRTFEAFKQRDEAVAETVAARTETQQSRALIEGMKKDIADLDARRAQAEAEQERNRLRVLRAEEKAKAATGNAERAELRAKFYDRVLETCPMTRAQDQRGFAECMARILASDAEFDQLSPMDRATLLARARPPAPTLTLTARPTSVEAGTPATLSWSSTNASACTASGAWSGGKAKAGTETVGAFPNTSTFTLTCTGPGGSANSSGTVTVVSRVASTSTADSGGGGSLGLSALSILFALLLGQGLRHAIAAPPRTARKADIQGHPS